MGGSLVGDSVDWGGSSITLDAAEHFAARVPVSPAERGRIARTLYDFPMECQVRGMFFQGLVDTISRAADRTTSDRLLTEAGVHTRFIPFVLMPHRDFYKLYFLASATLFPRSPLEQGFERIAEDFYPTFKESMVGRTLSAFIGKEPITILERLAQAYQMSVPWNEHGVRKDGTQGAIWSCKVEPSELYPATFKGIVRGTMRAHGVSEPWVSLVDERRDDHAKRFEFRVRW
ncbi:MAG: DUF2378 family protein [Sandaracinus sp.]|nr:DUF2378 family protein [Sandaracinus sp.]MCB9620122.1 DUF2378 family protein [Sandaracinus sp.]MCB9631676.1 DUF2378 family protein [Sandaracinus sp.]